jgi:hypothetical protein
MEIFIRMNEKVVIEVKFVRRTTYNFCLCNLSCFEIRVGFF